MYLYQLKIITTIYIVHHLLLININGKSAAQYYSVDGIAINCGSYGNPTALDGRQWVGDISSKFVSSQDSKGKSISTSRPVQQSFYADPIPYMTARLSRSQFTYTFQVKPGQKFIRLHFYPASYTGFERSKALLTVKAGPYTLLSNFSASLAADDLGVKHFAKEFCLSIEEEDQLFNITFSASKGTTSSSSSSDADVYAFINGIEIVSMPTGLYYTPEYDLGPHVVGNKFRFHIDKSIALEMVHRLNVGGRSILAIEDLGDMFRVWSEDKKFLLQYSGVTPVTTSTMIRYTGTPAYVAPPKVYQTAWSMGSNVQTNHQYNFTWKLPLDLGFRYLVRLHFCELEPIITVRGQKQFAISINNKIVETDADVIKWSGGNQQVAVYKDYVAMMEGDRMEGRRDLVIALQLPYQPSTENIDTILLKGIEIFKLSNPDNNLAGVNPAFTAHAPVVRIPLLRKLVSGFGTTDVIVTAATLVLVLLGSIVYQLNLSEPDSDKINTSSSSSHEEDLSRRFSIVEIQLATNNFDDARVIGKGGFGNVFKGFIDGGSKTVAIKRLNSGSGQGAREFWAEIDVLSKFRHNHLVYLIGYCDECQEMILVYEYMAHGTLADHLHKSKRNVNGNSPLPWEQRLNICIDAAQGFEFLHMGSGEQHGIIHRDVKSSNILLNENWVAKISDFGLSRISRLSCTHISTNIKGTFGYLDPQYFKTQRLTKRSDVYAFGVVLLEVLSGRQAVDITLEEEQHSLALWAQQCIRMGRLDELVDPTVKEQISPHCLKGFAEIANKCLRKQPNQRPTMTEIMARLKLITLELQGRDDSYRGQEVIHVGGTCNEHIDWSITSDESSQNEIKFKLADSISPTKTKTRELLRKKKDYGSNNNGPSWGWRLWGSLWHRTKPLKTLQVHCRGFSLEEIRAATNNFNDRLLMKNENGGDGKVYEGYLEGIGKVAIKRCNTSADFYNDFCTRLRVQSQIRCINIVSLVGYCYDNDWHEMILVHEYMANGSLFDHLHNTSSNNQRLSWKQRLQICIGAARGLNYLHTGSVEKTIIIHGVLKSSNILLDQNWVAKISDLESSMLVREEMKITQVADTVTEEKSDVYSFGLVLFEALSGRKEFNMEVDHDDQRRALSEWVLECIEAGSVEQIIEPYLIRKISPLCLSVFVEIARKCLLLSATERPRMTDVLSTLELSLELQETANVAVEYEMIKMVEPRNSKKEENHFEEVSESLARAGLESCNLIVGIDFTKSNEWTGRYSFNGRSLHHMEGLNPYEQSILTIGKTLAPFDKDNLIPCFGFGDASTHDHDVFSLHPDERFCNGFKEVLSRYREIAPHLRLSGPTSFAPIIEMAMSIVEQSGCRYHVLLIIADGQVTTDINGGLSPQEQRTVETIAEASMFPLSIILVGVGDGPWDMMRKFRDNIPDRAFNNFQFVNFTEIMSKNFPQSRKETEFALAALMEIPSQYKATIELNILGGGRKGNAPRRVPLPPPPPPPQCAATSAPNYSYDNQVCPICLSNPNDMAFGCGHQTCCDCGQDLQLCPICGVQIKPE